MSDLPPRRQRPFCEDCLMDTYGPPEKYVYDVWPASRCRRSRKYHRRQALARQPGTATYRAGQVIRSVPLPEENE
jgi:hypothetical protein